MVAGGFPYVGVDPQFIEMLPATTGFRFDQQTLYMCLLMIIDIVVNTCLVGPFACDLETDSAVKLG